MTVFSNDELVAVLHRVVRDYKANGVTDIPLSRPQIQGAVQAVREVLDSAAFRTAISDAIDAVISPETMTNSQKKRVFGRVIEKMFGGEVA